MNNSVTSSESQESREYDLLLDNPWDFDENVYNNIIFIKNPETFETLRTNAEKYISVKDEANFGIYVHFCREDRNDGEVGNYKANYVSCDTIIDEDFVVPVRLIKGSGRPGTNEYYDYAGGFTQFRYTFDNGTIMAFNAFICRGRLFINVGMTQFLQTVDSATINELDMYRKK